MWCSGLRIQLCHCRHLALIPGSGASTFFWHGQKKKKKELTHTELIISLQIEEFLLAFANLPLYFKKHVVRISFSFFYAHTHEHKGDWFQDPRRISKPGEAEVPQPSSPIQGVPICGLA